jgi:hypothetical protein
MTAPFEDRGHRQWYFTKEEKDLQGYHSFPF